MIPSGGLLAKKLQVCSGSLGPVPCSSAFHPANGRWELSWQPCSLSPVTRHSVETLGLILHVQNQDFYFPPSLHIIYLSFLKANLDAAFYEGILDYDILFA